MVRSPPRTVPPPRSLLSLQQQQLGSSPPLSSPSPQSQRQRQRLPGSSPPYACAELEEMELGRPSLDPLTSPDEKCGSPALRPHYLRPHTSTASVEGGPPAQHSSGSSLDGGPPSLCSSSSSDGGDSTSGEAAGSSGVDEQLASALVDRVLADLQVRESALLQVRDITLILVEVSVMTRL